LNPHTRVRRPQRSIRWQIAAKARPCRLRGVPAPVRRRRSLDHAPAPEQLALPESHRGGHRPPVGWVRLFVVDGPRRGSPTHSCRAEHGARASPSSAGRNEPHRAGRVRLVPRGEPVLRRPGGQDQELERQPDRLGRSDARTVATAAATSRCGSRQLRITAFFPRGFHEHRRGAMPNSVSNSDRDFTRPPGPATDPTDRYTWSTGLHTSAQVRRFPFGTRRRGRGWPGPGCSRRLLHGADGGLARLRGCS